MLDRPRRVRQAPPCPGHRAAATPGELRARLAGKFAQIGVLGKTRSWLKAGAFPELFVIAQGQSDAN
jgi:hypothetical protein